MGACAILHVTSLPGGGVDRHVRDIVRGVPRAHLYWHAAESAEVIEDPRARRFFPLAAGAMGEALAGWLRGRGVGLVHAHSIDAASRARVAWAASALGVPFVATLHDVLFLRREALQPGAPREADPAWLGATSAFLAGAAARIAPSDYLAALAREHLPGQEILVVPNGSPARAPCAPRAANADYAARPLERVAIVMGAIGPHKGARVLEEAATLLEGTGIGIVVIGYVDAQVDPGWRRPNLYIHGAYDDDEVPALVKAYGGQVALFPNQAPESFSYALSDLWDAGLPAIVPPDGALGERVRGHGAGWLLPEGFGAREVAETLRRILSPAAAPELARVRSALLTADPGRVPPLESMTRSLDALYARFGLDAAGEVDTQSAPAQQLIARNLDGALFRQELARVADELAQVKAGLAREREGAERFAREAREWIAKLERDVGDLQASLEAEVNERRRLGEENARLSVHEQALALLPEFIRVRLLKKATDARG